MDERDVLVAQIGKDDFLSPAELAEIFNDELLENHRTMRFT